MVANPKSWKDIRDRRRKENFVGRRNEMHLFEENFSESPRFMVFAITGEGGVGKSTLLDRFNVIAIASKIGAIVIKCDDKQGTPVVAMGHVASELGKLGISHKDFDERYKKYCELRQEIESDPKVPRSAVNVISMGITDFTIKSLRKAPGVGVFFEYADEKAAGEALTELIQYGISKWGNKDEVQLLREPERILTPLFIELINRACEKKRIVIMFDVFERTSDVLSPWLLALFDFKYGVFNTRLTFVISGRDSLEQHWTELAGMVCYIRLEPFMLDETRVYLSNQGISDEKLVNQIYQDTGGLPVLVELLAATKPTPGCDLPDISKDAVERFLQWTPEEDKRTVALLAAVPRQFNLDILGAILGEDATKLFNWLAIQSYIRRTTERGWFYHEKVRELMLRYIHSTTPAKLLDKHIKLFQYFSSSQEKLELSEKDQYQSDLWCNYEIEKTYHLLMAYPDQMETNALNTFFLAFRYNWKFAGKVANICQQAASENDVVPFTELANLLMEIYVLYERGDYRVLVEKFALIDNERMSPKALSGFLSRRGYANYWVEEYDKALVNYNYAIELDDKYAWAIASRGQTYRQMEKYKESLADFNRAIELDDKVAWVIASRGETYRLMEKYEEALADYTRAIELDDKYAWAVASRGLTYQLMKKYEESLTDFNHAIELDDKAAWVIASRGQTYRLMEKYEEALADYTRAIEVDDKYAWAVASRGLTYQRLKRYKEAITDLKNAVELEPDNANNICNYAGLLLGQGFLDEGFIMLDRAIKSLPIPNSPGVAAELWFYSFIHWPQKRKTALKNLKKVLCSGDRSLGWDFSENIARARQDERSDIDWIEKLALVISTNRDVSELDNWSDWKNV